MNKSIERTVPSPVLSQRQGRVLIVDADWQIRALVSEWLELSGYRAVEAHSAGAAPAAAAQCDIVLVDVRSPMPSARHAVADVMASAPRAAVIAMSADGLTSGRLAMEAVARELGVAAVLVKPFNRQSLMQAVERARHAF